MWRACIRIGDRILRMSPLHSAGSLLVANIFGNILYLWVPLQSMVNKMNFSFNTILFNMLFLIVD